jgi:7,8-dihydro-6-hydroxymethylpterin-pyrophosphokinase
MYSIKGKIIFEDGQGNVFDESENEATDWYEEVDPHNLENLTNLTRYLNKQVQPEMNLDSPDFVEKIETIEKNLKRKNEKQ